MKNLLFEAIKTATIAGQIEWKPTGEIVEKKTDREAEGQTCKFERFKLTTRVLEKYQKGFLSSWLYIAYGLSIEENGKKLTLTSDPKILPGKKTDMIELFNLILVINRESKIRDLPGLLHREITRKFLSSSKSG